jgi:hypothetical protein
MATPVITNVERTVKNNLGEPPVAVTNKLQNERLAQRKSNGQKKFEAKQATHFSHPLQLHSFENGVSECNRRYEKNRMGWTGAGRCRYSPGGQGLVPVDNAILWLRRYRATNLCRSRHILRGTRCWRYPCFPRSATVNNPTLRAARTQPLSGYLL